MSQYRGELGKYEPDQQLATAIIAPPVSEDQIDPLTGLSGNAHGPAAVVKIDNSRAAAPQAGLNQADIVIEEEVEWGVTRLATIFHTNRPVVGPVRSARTTDISFLTSLGTPALVYSGANRLTDTLILQQAGVQNFSAARSGAYWRERGRRAPSNLFTNTTSFVTEGSSPSPWFFYLSDSDAPVGEVSSQISLTLGVTDVVWSYGDQGWRRSQRGSAHLTASGEQVSAANVLVVKTRRVDTGMVDSAGGVVPEFIWAGTGSVTVYAGNRRIEGVWTRPTLRDVAVLTDLDGNPIRLVRGRTWIELVEG